MVTHRLFESAGTPTRGGATLSAIEHYATRFTVAQDGWLTELAWYRGQAASDPEAPTRLSLWTSTGTLVYDAPSIPDNGAVGRQVHTLTANVPLSASITYEVAGCFPIGNHQVFYSTTPAGPTAILAFVSNPRYFNEGACTFPNSQNAGTDLTYVEATWSDTAPDAGAQPPTTDDLQNALAGWLSTTDGTHADSAPLQDHATLATVNTNVAAVADQQNEWAFGLGAAAHGYFDALKTAIAAIKTVTDDLPTPIADLTSIVLDHYTADIAMILGQIDSVLSGLGAQSTDLSGTAGSAVGALSGRTGFPATGWSMAAEADFEDAIAFAEPADAYVLSITSYQPTQPATESPAGLWLYRLGWWCVLNGSLASRRQFVEFQQELLTDGGRRMPGCAIQLKPGTLATVQAWLLA